MTRNVNRAAASAADAVEDDRRSRGVGGADATRRRKVEARRAARRLDKAILAAEREDAR